MSLTNTLSDPSVEFSIDQPVELEKQDQLRSTNQKDGVRTHLPLENSPLQVDGKFDSLNDNNTSFPLAFISHLAKGHTLPQAQIQNYYVT